MPRTLGQLTDEERKHIISEIHRQAEKANWSTLNYQTRGKLYGQWEKEHDLSHATVKDGIMKGFDVSQNMPKKGEALIQQEIEGMFQTFGIYVDASPPMWTGKERADFLIGFSDSFLTHVVEVERADSWAEGLRQVLWYRAAFFQREARQIQPMLILFGDASFERYGQIRATCDDSHIVLYTHKLMVGGEPEQVNALASFLMRTQAT